MSQEQSLARLPRDVGYKVAALLNPLSRASLGRAFAGLNLIFNFTIRQKESAKVWDMIFKNSSWVDAAKRARKNNHGELAPTLVGSDLKRLCNGSSKTAYIALVLFDPDSCNPSLEKEFFASLREYTYDEQNFEVHFQNSNIILNVRNAITGRDWITMEKPERLTRSFLGGLVTSTLYFEDERRNIFWDRVYWMDNLNRPDFGPAQRGTECLLIELHDGNITVWDRLR